MSGLRQQWQASGKTIQSAVIAGVLGIIAVIIAGGFSLWSAVLSRAPQDPPAGSTGVAVAVDYRPSPSEWVSSLSPAEIGAPPGHGGDCGIRERLSWMQSKGAIQAATNYVKVTVVAKRESNVVIRGVELDVHRLQPPRPAYVYKLCQGGDGLDARVIKIDLDASPPAVRFVDYRMEAAEPSGGQPSFSTFIVTPDRPEVLLLQAATRVGSYAWTARLLLTVDGREQEQTVSDHGQPFKVTARPKGPSYLSNDPGGTPFVPGDV